MIEWAMIFALGALAASLLWLLALPVLSHRAGRLATARLARRMPMSIAELNVERDQIRAVHAVEVRRLEQAGEAASARAAALMSENGRHVARIVELEAIQARLQAEGQQLREELAAATLAMHDAQGTLGTQVLMLHQALELAERRGDLLNATEARLAAVHAIADEQRATIAGLEVRATSQDLRLRAALAQAMKLAEACAAAEAAMEEAIGERNIARANGHLAAAQKNALQTNADALTAEVTRLRTESEQARRAAARAEKELQRQAQAIDGLTERTMAQDHELTTLLSLLEEGQAQREVLRGERTRSAVERGSPSTAPATAASPEATVSRVGPGELAETHLRAAVAALGADLVAFATGPRAERPPSEAAEAGPSRPEEEGDASEPAVTPASRQDEPRQSLTGPAATAS